MPYIETLTLVATAVAEARGAAAGGDKEDVAFARNCLATGMDHLRGLSRRYSSSREARDFVSRETFAALRKRLSASSGLMSLFIRSAVNTRRKEQRAA